MESLVYPIDIVQRTKKMLEDHFEYFVKNDMEVTFLINCLLGLIIAVSENNKLINDFKQVINADKNFYNIIPKKVGFLMDEEIQSDVDLFKSTKKRFYKNIGHWDDLKSKSKIWFIEKLRNSIAHQHIEPINRSGRWKGVKMWNEYNNVRNFQIEYTILELKSFALSLADSFLNKN